MDMLKDACQIELRALLEDWKKLQDTAHPDWKLTGRMAARIHRLCDYLDSLDKG